MCEDGGAVTENAAVRPVADGIHIEFENRSGARHFYIRTQTDADQNQGGRLEPDGTTDVVTTMPPGRILVGCFERSLDIEYSKVTPEFARLTVVDAHGLWTSPELDCAEAQQEHYVGAVADGAVPPDVEKIIRAAVPDVLPTDRIVRPGYPETQWHGELRHVLRNGTAIASASVYAQHGRWTVSLRACPGAAIG